MHKNTELFSSVFFYIIFFYIYIYIIYTYKYLGRLFYDFKKTTFTYHYDSVGRLTTITDNHDNEISLGYNTTDGNLRDYDYTIDNKTITEDFYYYTTGNLKGEFAKTKINIDGELITKSYNYDELALNRLDNIVLSFGTTDIFNQVFTYDDESVKHGN